MDTPNQSGGVQLDEHGAPLAYHILRGHPGDLRAISREWDVVPAFGASTGRRQVLHHFDRRRPGQTRGVPYLAPVIEALKQIADYTEAELMAAVVSGMFTVFIKNEDGEANLSAMVPTSETGGSSSDEDYKLANGAIVGLAHGESIETANPGRPNAAFDPFVTAILRQIGVALEIPYELLVKHFQSSYSAARGAMLEAWRFFKMRRSWLVGTFNQPVYEAFLYEMVARGALSAPGFLDDPLVRHAYCGAIWTGRPMGHMQPLQEANAIQARIDAGISNRDIETAEYNGNDWEDVHQQAAREQKMRKADGLEQLPAPAPFGAPAKPPAPDAAPAEDDEADPEKDGTNDDAADDETNDAPAEPARGVNAKGKTKP
jgi:lambda family phage portal protein